MKILVVTTSSQDAATSNSRKAVIGVVRELLKLPGIEITRC